MPKPPHGRQRPKLSPLNAASLTKCQFFDEFNAVYDLIPTKLYSRSIYQANISHTMTCAIHNLRKMASFNGNDGYLGGILMACGGTYCLYCAKIVPGNNHSRHSKLMHTSLKIVKKDLSGSLILPTVRKEEQKIVLTLNSLTLPWYMMLRTPHHTRFNTRSIALLINLSMEIWRLGVPFKRCQFNPKLHLKAVQKYLNTHNSNEYSQSLILSSLIFDLSSENPVHDVRRGLKHEGISKGDIEIDKQVVKDWMKNPYSEIPIHFDPFEGFAEHLLQEEMNRLALLEERMAFLRIK